MVALAESAIGGGRGAQVALPFVPSVVGCFGEGPSAILLSTPEPEAVLAVAEEVGAPAVVLGEVGGDRLVVEGCLDVDLTRLKEAWEGGLQKSLQMVDDSAG